MQRRANLLENEFPCAVTLATVENGCHLVLLGSAAWEPLVLPFNHRPHFSAREMQSASLRGLICTKLGRREFLEPQCKADGVRPGKLLPLALSTHGLMTNAGRLDRLAF